jgi:S1-C subfamily serine protease
MAVFRRATPMPERAFPTIPSGSVWIALGILLTIVTMMPGQARAQTPPAENSVAALDAFSNAVESMVRRVSPSVVQILVTRYGGPEPTGRANAMVGWEHSIGSGVIVAPDGYIVTNAHVVAKAEQIRVRLVPAGTQTIGGVLAQSFSQPINATLVGSFAEADLALLKIAAGGLPAFLRSGALKACRIPSRWVSSVRLPAS